MKLAAKIDLENSYNGTSDLQLERMNVYFNEVRPASKRAFATSTDP